MKKQMKYSAGEEKMLGTLRKGRKRAASSLEIAEQFYAGDIPFHGRKIVISLLASLSKKAEANGEPFRVGRTKRRGPHPVSFWLEERGGY